jgi:gliding motility-associated-like protein
MRIKFLLLVIILLPALSVAQPYTSRLGRFQVDEIKGCAPFTVTIVRTDLVTTPDPLVCNGSTPCDMNWGDGTPVIQNDFSHVYAQPGTYTLSANYQTNGPDDIVITVLPNPQPSFNIYTCNNNLAQVEITDNAYDSYIIDFNGQSQVPTPVGASPVNFNFGSAGDKFISVRGRYTNGADNCTPLQKDVRIENLIAPTIDLLAVNSPTDINLEFTSRQHTFYRLEIGPDGGAFQNYATIHNLNTFTANQNLNTDTRYYCFRLGAVDRCSGAPPLFSNTICSARLTGIAQNNQNSLSWITSAVGTPTFEMLRDGSSINTNASIPLIDQNVVCGTEYCYQLISHYANGSRSISHERCITAISTDTPPAIQHVSSVVDDNSVELRWVHPPSANPQTFTVLRQTNNGTFNPITTTPATIHTDASYSLAANHCYRIDYEDVCGNNSPAGITACPITLNSSNGPDNTILLNWNAYNGWNSGVDHYELDKYDLQGTFLQTYNLNTSTTFTDNDLTDQGYRYVVRAILNPYAGVTNALAVSNELSAMRTLRFAYPKAFTPDNQGPTENETFKVFVTEEFIASFEMNIFNRWGEMIFSTRDLAKGWDGKFNGKPQPEGTYIFTAVLVDKTGRTFKRDGSVMLLRKR